VKGRGNEDRKEERKVGGIGKEGKGKGGERRRKQRYCIVKMHIPSSPLLPYSPHTNLHDWVRGEHFSLNLSLGRSSAQ